MSVEEITALESELRAAQLGGDVAGLDRLIAGELLFTGPDGAPVTKADDLAAYSQGVLHLASHEPESLQVQRVTDDVFLVALRTRLAGHYAGAPFSGVARYTRVWSRDTGRWLIVGGHASMAVDEAV